MSDAKRTSPTEAAFEHALKDLRASLSPDHTRDPALVAALDRVAAVWRARQAEEDARDHLTGVRGRRALLAAGGAVAAMSKRAKTPLAVVLAGVDNLREINDRHGDASGDRALAAVAGAIAGAVRRADVVGRYGGDVFAVIGAIASGAPTADIEGLAEKTRAAVAALQTLDFPVSASVGAAVAHVDRDPDHALHALLVRADENLYLAKRAGRNRVVTSQLDLPQT